MNTKAPTLPDRSVFIISSSDFYHHAGSLRFAQTSVVVMADKTSWFQVSFAKATSELKESLDGISRSLKSQAVSAEMNDIPILDSTTSLVALVAESNEMTAPSLFLPETLVLFPKEASLSPRTLIPENVRARDGGESKEPQKKIFQSSP